MADDALIAPVEETGAVLPEGTVTLLLADLESSTNLWQHDGAAALAAHAELDALVADAVASHDGVLPTVQGEGDSFVAAFTHASRAVACALDIQQRSKDAPLRFRMGLHTGEILVREDRYAGTTIIRTARVRDLGHGGQILVTSTTRDLVLDALPPGCDLVDLGEQELKGLDRGERVHQLTHADLRPSFPPLRSRATRSRLPARLTSFIGRDGEMADLGALVASERLVTLTGAGGCGKTRLAIEVAARLDVDVWFCDLAPLADPDVVAAALCTTIGASTEGHPTALAAACEHLVSSEGLVVLDNCEHLIDESAAVADALLSSCPRLRVVATSREPLGVVGEVPWRVPSLSAPRADDVVEPRDLESYASVALFLDRASTVRPGFVLNEQNARPIASICARLDGIPLAIELAAARVRVLSPREIAEGLNDRFRMLGRGARTLLPRQQTLEASVAWSHDLLTAEQRAVLRRCSIFAGGFTLEAAEQVTASGDVEPTDVLELLAQLVDRSLVVADETANGARYRMLETIRIYARERLIDAGEANDVALRHLRWFEKWIRRELRRALSLADGRPVYDRVDDDYENMRAATEWAITRGEATSGVRLVSPLVSFLGIRTQEVRFHEAAEWLQQLLAHDALDDPTRAYGLVALSFASAMVGDYVTGVPAADEAVALARGIGPSPVLARALWAQGSAEIANDPERAAVILEEAIAVAREAGDPGTVVGALGHLCQAFSVGMGDPARGLPVAAELPPGAQRDFYTGFNLYLSGQLDDATAHLTSAAAGYQAVGNTYWECVSSGVLSAVALARGDLDGARRLGRGALALASGAGNHAAFPIRALVEADAIAGEFEAALGHLDWFLHLGGRSVGDPSPLPAFTELLTARVQARAALRSGKVAQTREAAALLDRADTWPGPIFLLELSALLERTSGELSRAETRIIDVLAKLAQTRAHLRTPDALEIRAALFADVGGDEDAVRLFAAAAAAREQMGSVGSYHDVFDVEAAIQQVRVRLGDDAFATAWDAGTSLSLDDALALALRGRGPRQRPQAGWDAITPTERQVIDLVVEGLTNPQIAERMFISKRTVSTHLSHVFAKVGVSSRAELAAASTRRNG